MELRAMAAATRKNVSSREKGQIEDGGTSLKIDLSPPEETEGVEAGFRGLDRCLPVFPFPFSSFQTRLK